MPTLSYRADQFTLSNPYNTPTTLYEALVSLLPNQGFTNVANAGDHVHCDIQGISLSITFLALSGNTYWRLIMAAEDSDPTNADTQIERVQGLIDVLQGGS